MKKLIKIGETDNISVYEYWCETEEEIKSIVDAPLFSKGVLVTEEGELIIYIMRSNGWTKIK